MVGGEDGFSETRMGLLPLGKMARLWAAAA